MVSALLLHVLSAGFALQGVARPPAVRTLPAARMTPQMSEAEDALAPPAEPAPPPVDPAEPSPRAYDKAEEKALRSVRVDFGGYPEGKYYKIEAEEGAAAAYAKVREDHPALKAWSDEEILVTRLSLKSTPVEILLYTPIGPFIVLSAIAIWRDGLSAWGIPPCREVRPRALPCLGRARAAHCPRALCPNLTGLACFRTRQYVDFCAAGLVPDGNILFFNK